MDETKFTFIDLFAGIGGFKMALNSNGGTCLGFSEVNKDAINTYCENYKVESESNFGDILHYQKIIVALSETDRLMKEIDKIEIE